MWAIAIVACLIALTIFIFVYSFMKVMKEEEKPSYRYGEKPSYFNYERR